MPVVLQVSLVVATLAFVAIAVALVRTLGQVRRTARQVEHTMASLDDSIPTLTRTIDEARGMVANLGRVSERVDRVVGEFEVVGVDAARASQRFVHEVIEPVGQVAAIARGVRAGASTFVSRLLTRDKSPTPRLRGGNHDE